MKKESKKDNKLYDFDFEFINSSSKSDKKNKKSVIKNKNEKKIKKQINTDEIIIGVTNKTLEKGKNKTEKNKTVKKDKYKNISIKNSVRKRNIKIIKIILFTILIITAIIFAVLSPIFNIKDIEIVGNKQVKKEEILSLSQIQYEENIFKINTVLIKEKIKENAYIKEINILRKLPSKVYIEITERIPSFNLEYGNGFVYINNQGYMLEISSIKNEKPIIVGTTTLKQNYKTGNRLNEDDLIKLGNVIKIMNSVKMNNIEKLITKIDIRDGNDYKIYMEQESKTIHLGDCSNIETKILYMIEMLEKEKGKAGDIFINRNLNKDKPYFRENV